MYLWSKRQEIQTQFCFKKYLESTWRKQQTRSTYNLTLRRVHETTDGQKKAMSYIFLGVCVEVRACVSVGVVQRVALLIQHVTRRHIVIWGLSCLLHIFPRLTNEAIFEKTLLNITFWVSLQLLFEKNSHSKKNSVRYCHKCENVFM